MGWAASLPAGPLGRGVLVLGVVSIAGLLVWRSAVRTLAQDAGSAEVTGEAPLLPSESGAGGDTTAGRSFTTDAATPAPIDLNPPTETSVIQGSDLTPDELQRLKSVTEPPADPEPQPDAAPD